MSTNCKYNNNNIYKMTSTKETSAEYITQQTKGVPNFLGVFFYDTLPSPLPVPCCFIMNTDSSSGLWSHNPNSIGVHWVAGVVYGGDKPMILFQGMYGQGPPQYNLNYWKKQFGNSQCYYVNVYSEKLNANNCGPLAISFVKESAKGLESLEIFLDKTALKSDE